MLMPDVNVLVYAHKEGLPQHRHYAEWVTELATSPAPFALSGPVMQGFVRVVTNPKIFKPASTVTQAMTYLDALLERPTCVMIRSGARHWEIFRELCVKHKLKGKLVADAAHAALAIENGCEWVSADTDFARFAPALRFQHL